ncbi:receptor-type tyrosine-protein phosphatase H [Bufo bufo]|uniref:receptor-type tyrosine-protein phosphatase H n=1 Tax=Bufo bufo TaxID=8384 RepID=UPI001ABDCAD5|nr:receptor-type tyrosine-protein phosphatase H [Bufo bufo]
MAFHYITQGRCHLPSLLLTVLLCLGAHRIIAVTAPPEVLNLTTANVSENSFTVSWEAPTTGNITDYRIIISNGTILTNRTTTSMSYRETGLSPGITYNITIYTFNENGTSSGFLHNVTTLPSPVEDLNVTDTSDNSVTLVWALSTDPNAGTYTYTGDGGGSNRKTDIKTNTIEMTALQPGTDYTFTVYAVTSNRIYSEKSNIVNATTLPSPVKNLTVISKSDNSVTLMWTLSPEPNNHSYIYTVDGGGENKKTNIKTNTVVMTNLQAGVNYNFTVFAVTSNGRYSKSSNVVNVTTQPSIVQGVKESDVSETTVTLQWDFSQDINNKTYTYTVDCQGSPSFRISSVKNNSVAVENLKPGEDYNLTVFAVTENLIYSQSSKIVPVTTMPSPAENLTVISKSDNSVTLMWTFSPDPNNHSYTYTVDGGGENKMTNIKTNTVVMTNLQAGVNYNFTVFAVTSNGRYSKSSNVVNVTTQPSIVQGVQESDVSETTVTLQWDFSQDINNKTYTYTVDCQGSPSFRISSLKNNSVAVENLKPGEDYNLTVFAVTENGIYSQSSKTVSVTTMPSPVENLTVISKSDNSVTLMWTFSPDPNNHSYTYTVDGGGENKKTNIKTNTVVMTNLQAGVNYNFTVFAVTSNGRYSKSSNVANATTQPSIVQGVQESEVSNTTVTLQWDFSQDINNKTYTYTVDCQGSPSFRISSLKNNSVAVENLKPGEDYNLTVFAVTENGIYSQSSNTVSLTTMPNAPENLKWSAIDVSKIYVNWSAPADPNEEYYDYQVIWIDTMTSGNHSAYTNDTHLNIKDLLPGHSYNITVTSVIKKILSVEAVIYTVTKPLSAEKVTVSSINNNSATIKWTLPNTPGSIVSGYRVTVYVDGNNTSEKYVTEEACVLDGLIPGTIYTFKVESYAKYPISGSANRMAEAKGLIISYSTPSTITDETVPDQVTDFKCSKSEAYQITVYFVCPAGNYSAFKVLVDNGAMKKVDTCPDDVIIPNLQPAASYKIRVMTVATNTTAVTREIICSTDNIGVIVGSIFGILLFFLLIALIVYFVQKRRRQKETGENMTTATFNTRRVHTIPKDKFKLHYETNHADSDFGFAEEYQELSSVGTTQSKRVAELPENRTKNRFINVLPYDHSRVKLSIMNGISTSDYINANYMPGYNSTKEFIASQGPLPNTTSDFWRMIWEHQVNTIVMLTNCMENGRVKCEHYWPLDYTPCTYGDITVTVTSETILSEWTIGDFSIKHAKEPGIKYVRHFHFTAWPDHGVPDSTSSIIQFRNLVREYMDERKSSGPTVVHCSAGVGRTGTLIALDYLMQQIEKEQCIGIYSFVEKMRIHRNLMVQTEEQYIFLNKCMVDLILEPNDEHIYENHTGPELVYENVNAIRDFQRENA